MKSFIFLFFIFTSLSHALTDPKAISVEVGDFQVPDPGGFEPFYPPGGSPPLGAAARSLDLSSISTDNLSCSFTVNSSDTAEAAVSAIQQVMRDCPATTSTAVSPLQGISQIYTTVTSDPQSCLNYERTYDQLFRRVSENPEIASGEVSMCVRPNSGGEPTLNETCLVRTIARLKESRRLQCDDERWRQARQTQAQAIQQGLTEIDRVLTGVIDNFSSTCPQATEESRGRIIESLIGTASQLLSIPLAGTGIDLGIGLLSSSLSRLFGSNQNRVQDSLNQIVNTENFTNLACLHESLQKEVNNCDSRNAFTESNTLQSQIAGLESKQCVGVLGNVGANLESFIGDISRIRGSIGPEGSTPCSDPQNCTNQLINVISGLSRRTGDGSTLASVALSSAQENKPALESRRDLIERLRHVADSSEAQDEIRRAGKADDPYFADVLQRLTPMLSGSYNCSEGTTGPRGTQLLCKSDFIDALILDVSNDLEAANVTINFLNAVCVSDCDENLSLDNRRANTQNMDYLQSVLGAMTQSPVDPISALRSSILLRTDNTLHAGSSLSHFARQFALSSQIQMLDTRLRDLSGRMATVRSGVADFGPQNARSALIGLEAILTIGGRNSLLNQQLNSSRNAVDRALSTQGSGFDRSSEGRAMSFESTIKPAFMICNQLHTVDQVNAGQSQPSHPLCQNFSCAFSSYPPSTTMPNDGSRRARPLSLEQKYLNGNYSEHLCSNLDQKDNRLNLLRNNFISTGQTCPQATNQ